MLLTLYDEVWGHLIIPHIIPVCKNVLLQHPIGFKCSTTTWNLAALD